MLLNGLLLGAAAIWVVQTIVTLIVLVKLSRNFKVSVDQMKLDNAEQANRVDGLVRQYRTLSKDYKAKVTVLDNMTKEVKDLKEYVEDELVLKMDEAMLSVDAILDNDWEDVEPEPVRQPVSVVSESRNNGSQNGNKGGLAAVDQAAKNNGKGTYSRYQELRDQGFTAKEATEMMRKEGKRG